MATRDRSGGELLRGQCHDRLLASRHGFLSCTRHAMPFVVPVGVDCSGGAVQLVVHDRQLCGPLSGHVVALMVAAQPGAAELGWVVVAVGRLGPADGEAGYPFEVFSLEGWTFAAAVQPAACR